jgi:hypothetical protein
MLNVNTFYRTADSYPGFYETSFYVSSSPILVVLIMEALISSETSVRTRVTLRNIREDAFLHSHRRENLKSYV